MCVQQTQDQYVSVINDSRANDFMNLTRSRPKFHRNASSEHLHLDLFPEKLSVTGNPL